MALAADMVTIYTNRSCINNGRNNACSGADIWIAESHPTNKAIRIPGNCQSNQSREIVAVLTAIQSALMFASLEVKTDS